MLTAEQVIAANKANVETLFGLTNKAFEGIEKLVELNLQVAKAALGEAADTTKAAMSVKDAQELFALQAGLLQPAAEKAAAYSRHLYDIAAATNAEVTKVAEEQARNIERGYSPFDLDKKGLGAPMLLPPGERAIDDTQQKFAAPTSMRDTEPTVHLWLRYGLGKKAV